MTSNIINAAAAAAAAALIRVT